MRKYLTTSNSTVEQWFPRWCWTGLMASQQWFTGLHLTYCTSELQPVSPSTPDSLVSVVITGLERIERECPCHSNVLWPFVLSYLGLSHHFISGFRFPSVPITVFVPEHCCHSLQPSEIFQETPCSAIMLANDSKRRHLLLTSSFTRIKCSTWLKVREPLDTRTEPPVQDGPS